MVIIQENFSLKNLNTFGVEAKAKYFVEIENEDDILESIANKSLNKQPLLILGGGSNILFVRDFDGIILKNNLFGKSIVEETEDSIIIESLGGEVWHDLVEYSLSVGANGIENLSYIPGTVGAAPIQNIGAYGVELKDSFLYLDAIHLQTGEKIRFTKEDCHFGYRESIFKQEFKNQFFISKVALRLSKYPNFHLNYGEIQKKIEEKHISTLTSRVLSQLIGEIRHSKLPNPLEIGNSGSFFKNSIVEKKIFEKIAANYPNIPHYTEGEHLVKIPTGWLIEQCGWKGKTIGNIGVYPKQALVLVNYGGGTGQEIYNLSEQIIQSVLEKFNIRIEREVNVC